MEININRDVLLPALQIVAPAIETRQTLPVLSNVLWTQQDQQLQLLGTDLEIELIATIPLPQAGGTFATTLPARRLLDIVRALPEGTDCQFRFTAKQCQLHTTHTRFVLPILSADNFPRLKSEAGDVEFLVKQNDFLELLQMTFFAMAVQDVRYYLNGLYVRIQPERIVAIAADGHRLARCEIHSHLHEGLPTTAFLLPRNAVAELLRLLEAEESLLTITIGKGYCRIASDRFIFGCKLIEGRVPDYQKAIPAKGAHQWTLSRDALKAAINRVALVINDKTKGLRLTNKEGFLLLQAYDAEFGEAEEQLSGEFEGGSIDVGINATYLLDVLNTLPSEKIHCYFSDSYSSTTIEGAGIDHCFYVIMPMRV